MERPGKFILHFSLFSLILLLLIMGLVTWTDPFRNLNFPWKMDFLSDRNQAYKRFKLIEDAKEVTDLVIGSSTSEIFVPQVLKERFGVNAFASNSGGASLPLRVILIRHALSVQPNLKRIIYVSDLFEFAKAKLETQVYYQPEMRGWLDPRFLPDLKPDLSDRFNDFFSFTVIDRAIRTWKDYLLHRKGLCRSSYNEDGSTTRSMIGGKAGDSIEKRVMSSAIALTPLYSEMTQLDPIALELFTGLLNDIKTRTGVEVHLILSPFHELFYERFKDHFSKTGLYQNWITTLQSFEGPNIHVHDFSYPRYFEHGITSLDSFWQDGTHTTSEVMLKMAEKIYQNP
ncbi:MAG: hypothetical protein KGP28_10310 [Bdellovibrionales bacterium]|nr:hypothetical protein [Bdellovibrionales bacterium]